MSEIIIFWSVTLESFDDHNMCIVQATGFCQCAYSTFCLYLCLFPYPCLPIQTLIYGSEFTSGMYYKHIMITISDSAL
jgi:hypothetical protein